MERWDQNLIQINSKFGDGSTTWNSLAYADTSAGSFRYGLYTLSANQTSNISVGNHVEWNTAEGSLGGLSTGSGQENGIITLPAGKTYKITCVCRGAFSGSGSIVYQVYDNTNSTFLGLAGMETSTDLATHASPRADMISIVTPETEIDIEFRFVSVSVPNSIYSAYSWALIEEYGGY